MAQAAVVEFRQWARVFLVGVSGLPVEVEFQEMRLRLRMGQPLGMGRLLGMGQLLEMPLPPGMVQPLEMV